MKSLMTISLGLLLFISLAIGTLFVAPGKAHASASDCLAGHVCFFKDINYAGNAELVYVTQLNQCYNLSWFLNDEASSIYVTLNFPSGTVYYYENANCSGQYIISGAGNGAGWSWVGSAWNDRISSFKVVNF